MTLKNLVPSLGSHLPIETRLFEITLVLTVVLLYFWSVFGFFFGYEWPVMSIYVGGAIIYTGFYIAFKRWSIVRMVAIGYYSLIYVMLAIAWLPSGGVMGAIHNMFVLVFLSGLLILRPRDFRLFIFFALLLVVGFTAYELSNPDAAAKYTDRLSWMIDLSVSNIVMLLVLSFTIFYYKKAYESDREKLKAANLSLQEEKRKVESADRIKTTFFNSISHEIRTPLNGIVGNLDFLRRTPLTEEQMQLVTDIGHSSDVLHGLISDILDITMMDEEGMVLQEDQIDLHHVVSNVVQFFIPKAAQKSGHVLVEYHPDERIPRHIMGDLTRIRQVLINLVNNAVKFTDEGKVVIRSELLSSTGKEAMIKIAVADTGRGIPVDQQPYIFNRFERNDSDHLSGIGLGLSVCKKIVEAIGGEIGLEWSSEEGTCFYFVLPFRIQEPDPQEGVPPSPTQDFKKLRVLVAEDQQINQMVARKMLSNLGIQQIDMAGDGEQAVQMAAATEYDFILMDVRMPLKNGIEAAAEILAAGKGHLPVIVAVTANVTNHEMQQCFSVGMKDFISKPFTLEVLRASFEKFVFQRV